jgi:hypothetical protein
MTTPQTIENSATPSSGGFTYRGSLVVTAVVTCFGMVIDVVPDKTIDYIAPASLVLVSLFVAAKTAQRNFMAAVWGPVLAWFIALVTIGQLARPSAGSAKERELVLIVHGLADHAWWVLGATALSAVVVAIRRFR